MEENRLISLEDWNKSVNRQAFHKETKELLIGIACPNCGSELKDQSEDQMLLSSPPQKRTECPNCDYKGTRYIA